MAAQIFNLFYMFSIASYSIAMITIILVCGLIVPWITKNIQSFCTKLSSFNGLMCRTMHCFSRKTLLMFFEVYAKPVILYGLLVYGSSNKSNLEKVSMKQEQIIRTIFHYRKFDSTSKTCLENKIDSVYNYISHY